MFYLFTAGADFPICNTCGGDCDSQNGCNCVDGFTTCVPTDCVMDSNSCCDMLPDWYYDPIKSCCTRTYAIGFENTLRNYSWK